MNHYKKVYGFYGAVALFASACSGSRSGARSDAGATPDAGSCLFNGTYQVTYVLQPGSSDAGVCPTPATVLSFSNNQILSCTTSSEEVAVNGTALQVSFTCSEGADAGAVESCSGVATNEEGCRFTVGIELVGRI